MAHRRLAYAATMELRAACRVSPVQEKIMHLVAHPDAQYARPRISGYPAPLCEVCNVSMKLNGEYGSGDDTGTLRREYQCGMCGCGTIVRRTRRRG